MKVLLVVNGFPPRGRFGTEFYAGELARGLVARGHEVEALCRADTVGDAPPSGAVETIDGAHGVPLHLVHAPAAPGRALVHAWRDASVERAFADLLDAGAFDAVHFLQLAWGLSFELPALARARGVRTVLTVTDYGLVCHRGQMFDHTGARCGGPHPASVCARCLRRPAFGLEHGAARTGLADLFAALGGPFGVVTAGDVRAREAAAARALAHVDQVLAPSTPLVRVFEGRGAPVEPLVYAFDEAPYANARPERDPARLRLAFLGQLAPHKGAEVLLDGFARARRALADTGVAAELALVGSAPSGRYAAWADRLVAGLPEGARVEPPFEPGEAPRVLAGVDAVVVPSLWDENAPLVCLEARAAGTRLVASRVPGIVDLVTEGVHGHLFAPGDPEDLARALVAAAGATEPAPRGLPLALDAHLERIEAAYRGPRG